MILLLLNQELTCRYLAAFKKILRLV